MGMALRQRNGDAMTKQRARAHAHKGGILLKSLHVAGTRARFEPFTTIFAQADRCADVMYIGKGRVRLSRRRRKAEPRLCASFTQVRCSGKAPWRASGAANRAPRL